MESIRPDHEIELTFSPVLESNLHGSFVLLNPLYAVTKNDLNFAVDLAEDGGGQVRAGYAGVAALCRPEERLNRESGYSFSTSIHDAEFLDRITLLEEFR